MIKYKLQSRIKCTETAYRLWFVFVFHYAYLGKWRPQFLYWFTFGGFFIWAIIDLFTLSAKDAKHNDLIFLQLDEIERKEREQNKLGIRKDYGVFSSDTNAYSPELDSENKNQKTSNFTGANCRMGQKTNNFVKRKRIVEIKAYEISDAN